jgi:tetratricopeptide (TPR) repeat protein
VDTILYIDEYFTGQLSPAAKLDFEKRIAADPAFAEEVSFYLTSKDVIQQQATRENKERFKDLYEDYKKINSVAPKQGLVRRLLPYAAVAAVLTGLIIGWTLFSKPDSPQQLADKYINEHFKVMGVTMGTKENGLQTGIRLLNEGKLPEALAEFENTAAKDSLSYETKKYIGIVCLRMQQYDKAINSFSQLAANTNLYANPGKLYLAITLLSRDQPGDKEQAKNLLQQVLQNDIEGKETAKMLLDKW